MVLKLKLYNRKDAHPLITNFVKDLFVRLSERYPIISPVGKRNANGILKCNGYAEDWFPTTTPLPTSRKDNPVALKNMFKLFVTF
ncbi:MAG: hypothetical protein IPK08_12030 [Bacteroidetes bacterium]|nr:hypothetical protein [Bacteroidota bacterium]